MTDETPAQTPEGRLIEEAANATGRSIRSLAANAGMSDTRWRHVVKGWAPGPKGQRVPVRSPALPLARMALVVGVSAEQLVDAGREDAAKLMERLDRISPGDTISDLGRDVVFVKPDGTYLAVETKNFHSNGPDEIDLIYASNMSAKEKLLRIRQVLQLRAQVEAEEQALRHAGTEEALADVARASDENSPESQQS